MTITAPPPAPEPTAQLWNTMPGWGITANLLPPEVLGARRIAAIRKFIVMGLVFVLALGAVGFGFAFVQKRQAESALSAEQSKTLALQASQQQYAPVVTLTNSIADTKQHLATLMADDVDATKLVENVAAQLPPGSTITQLQVALDAASQQSTSTSTTTGQGGSALDTSGQSHIGSLTVTGTTASLSNVAGYVNALGKLPGVVSVFPSSQGKGATNKGVQFTIELTLTDQLLTHRFDVATTSVPGGK